MRVVVDRCCMASQELRDFLSLAPDNIAVLTDYAAIEAFKGDTLENIQSAWTVLRDFPAQMIALKDTRSAALVDPRAAGIANRMINKKETKALENFSRVIDSAQSGNRRTQKQLLQRGKWAQDHLDRMLAKSAHMRSSIEAFCSHFTPDELKRMRRLEQWSGATALKFMQVAIDETAKSFDAHPDKLRWPGSDHRFNHFLFRHTIAYMIYVMELVRKGAIDRKAAIVRNDAVDVVNVTFATYFDGFMTDDERAGNTHNLTRYLLDQVGARVPEDYLKKYRA
ncbi:hypothetical protein E2E30_08950 [Sphingomonas sp. AAP5]|uniref:hypothetical protein n=1 Tax=Sphingomonas sp. AAP5 TaxID=1523415 RepID=UPI001057220C|nr:hypothetical protein [Sphingomonas sp. AAP5]QBM75886.1 hypothetical protein E2E30_08950 [Sphingomonas sp. AAP5]